MVASLATTQKIQVQRITKQVATNSLFMTNLNSEIKSPFLFLDKISCDLRLERYLQISGN